jgi:hypothetical protein
MVTAWWRPGLVSLTADDIDALYRSHARAMVTFFARRTLDAEAAVDLVAETFAMAIAERGKCRAVSDDERVAWLYGIARNHLSGWYRRGAIERRALERVGLERPALTEVDVERLEELAELAELRRAWRPRWRRSPRRRAARSSCGWSPSSATTRWRGSSGSPSRPRALACRAGCARSPSACRSARRREVAEPDLPVLERLGHAVHEAAQRAERGSGWRVRRWSPRVLALVALVWPGCGGVGGRDAARPARLGDPGAASDPGRAGSRPGTARMAGFSVPDPARGQPRWTLRLATSQTGLLCSTVGQQVGGSSGSSASTVASARWPPKRRMRAACAGATPRRWWGRACSTRGARATSAPWCPASRATSYARCSWKPRAGAGPCPCGRSGVFLAVLAGLPEDLGLRVQLRFADGHRERHGFGVAPTVVRDPPGGRAWRIQSGMISGDDRTCMALSEARQRRNPVVSPAACGRLRRTGTGRSFRQRGIFFAVRRVTPGTGGLPADFFGEGRWQDTPPRLIVLGAAGNDVAALDVRGPAGAARTGTWFRPNGSFAYVFGPSVRPGEVTVTVRFRDGRRLVRRASTNLVAPPTFGRGGG